MRPTPAIFAPLAIAASAIAQSNSAQDSATLIAALQARSQAQPTQTQQAPTPTPAWTPPPSQPYHKNSFNNLGIGSTGRGNFISPHRSVTEIPGYIFNPATGQPPTSPSTGPITIQPYPYPINTYPYYNHPYYRPPFYDYNGFYANGRYRGDHWNINFNLGTGLMPSMYDFGGLLPIRVGNYEYSINPYTGSYVVTTAQSCPDAYDAQGRARTIPSPPVPQAPAARELTSLEKAQLALRDDEPQRAVKELRAHLRKEPADANAMRVLAIALFENRNLDDGVAVLRNAYRTSPSLADEPLSPSDLGISSTRFREMLSDLVQYAHKINSASAWLSVTTLMQAEGRSSLAKEMLSRADQSGLDRQTRIAFEQALH